MKKKIMPYLLLSFLLPTAIFFCIAFGNWDANPKNWDGTDRGMGAFFMLVSMFAPWAFYAINLSDD